VTPGDAHPTRAIVHLDRLAHNIRLLAELADGRPLWPGVKANAYGHGAVEIARALVTEPAFLLLDEPYTGLDQDACEMLDGILKKVAAQGRTILMTSHDLSRAADLASRFDVLSRGRIVASATQAEIEDVGLLDFYKNAIHKGANGG